MNLSTIFTSFIFLFFCQVLQALTVHKMEAKPSNYLDHIIEKRVLRYEKEKVSKDKIELLKSYQEDLRGQVEVNSLLRSFIDNEKNELRILKEIDPQKKREKNLRKKFSKIDNLIYGLEQEYKKRGSKSDSVESYIKELKKQQRVIHSKYNRLRMNRLSDKRLNDLLSEVKVFESLYMSPYYKRKATISKFNRLSELIERKDGIKMMPLPDYDNFSCLNDQKCFSAYEYYDLKEDYGSSHNQDSGRTPLSIVDEIRLWKTIDPSCYEHKISEGRNLSEVRDEIMKNLNMGLRVFRSNARSRYKELVPYEKILKNAMMNSTSVCVDNIRLECGEKAAACALNQINYFSKDFFFLPSEFSTYVHENLHNSNVTNNVGASRHNERHDRPYVALYDLKGINCKDSDHDDRVTAVTNLLSGTTGSVENLWMKMKLCGKKRCENIFTKTANFSNGINTYNTFELKKESAQNLCEYIYQKGQCLAEKSEMVKKSIEKNFKILMKKIPKVLEKYLGKKSLGLAPGAIDRVFPGIDKILNNMFLLKDDFTKKTCYDSLLEKKKGIYTLRQDLPLSLDNNKDIPLYEKIECLEKLRSLQTQIVSDRRDKLMIKQTMKAISSTDYSKIASVILLSQLTVYFKDIGINLCKEIPEIGCTTTPSGDLDKVNIPAEKQCDKTRAEYERDGFFKIDDSMCK